MTEPSSCSTCGAPIPGGSPGGACPRCLMAVGFATDAGVLPPDVKAEEVEQRFPGYEVKDPLGQGGMGVVFRARQKALDREVALKVLPAVPGRGTEFADRFQREAKALARLQHPGIVQVFDFGVSADGWCYLAMELVEGANLRRSLSQGRLTPREALAIVPQICDALQYAHDQGVVHRDIKPENVLLAKDGRVKIADFGLAKLVQGAREPVLTGTGHVMGTPHYMAPEQLEHPGDVDHRADIYSLGVVFYEMLTGELPLGRFPPPSRRSDVDARIDEIVLRTLEKEREARFQRVSEIRTSIAAASVAPPPLDRVDVPTPAPYPIPGPPRGTPERKEPLGPPPKLSRLAAASALAPIGVALVALGAWYANEGAQFETRLAVASVWAAAAVFAAMVAGVAAWAHVRHSGGKLYGRRFALLAMVLAPIAAFVPSPFVAFEYQAQWRVRRASASVLTYGGSLPVRDDQTYTMASPDGTPRVARYVDGHEVPLQAKDEELGVLAHGPAIRDLVERAQKVWPSASPSLITDLYPSADLMFLHQLEPEIVQERKQAGTMGLPLTSRELLGNTLQAFRVEKVEVDPDRTSGAVVLTDGARRVRARVAREWQRWVFKFAPVEVLPDAPAEGDTPPPETGDESPPPEEPPRDDEPPPPVEVPPPEPK